MGADQLIITELDDITLVLVIPSPEGAVGVVEADSTVLVPAVRFGVTLSNTAATRT